MAGNWTDDCFPIQSVFGRTGAVVAASGDYTADQITYDTGLAVASPPDVRQALDALYDYSPLGDKPMRVTNDDFLSNLHLNGSTATSVADAGIVGSGLSGSSLSNGAFGWDGAAGCDLLREASPSGSLMSGIWTIRVTGSNGGIIGTKSALFPSAHSRVRVAARIQILPTAQSVGVGFFGSSFTQAACLDFITLASSVFTIRFKHTKSGTTATTTLPYTSVNEPMTVIYTLSNFGTLARAAIYNAAGALIGPILEIAIPSANQLLTSTAIGAGVYSYGVASPGNTPTLRVDYLELGIAT
jgi:hypothetical protein